MNAPDIFSVDTNHLFLYFLLYSFVGWCCEEIWCCVPQKKLVNRGMLHGPICPIYGFGALGILFIVHPLRNTWIPLFFASVFVTSALEYFTSWLLETLFHAKWWDYSGKFMNLNGRCCLLNSVAFGIGGLALEHLMHPIATKILYFPAAQPYIKFICGGLAALLATDLVFTIRKLVDFGATLEKFKAYGELLKDRFEGEEWFRPQSLGSMIESIRQKAKTDASKFSARTLETVEKYAKKQKIVEYWLKRFPSMTSRHYEHTFEHLKQAVVSSWNEKKQALKEKREQLWRK